MAKPSVIEARKAAAMEDLAARLTAIESHLTGGAIEPGVLMTSEIEPIGPKFNEIKAEVSAIKEDLAVLKAGMTFGEKVDAALAAIQSKLDAALARQPKSAAKD